MALIKLRSAAMDELPRVIWVIVMVMLPIVGSVAFFIVAPGSMRNPGGPE